MNKKLETKSKLREKIVYYLYVLLLIILTFLLVSIFSALKAQSNATERNNALTQAEIAAQSFQRVMQSGDKEVFLSLLGETQCAVVFPSVSEADYLEIRQGRRGMASCRLAETWGASVFVVMQIPIGNIESGKNRFSVLLQKRIGLNRNA